jgi:hypothetical protein
MDKKEFELFMREQTNAINVYKWCQSEKAGHDLGNDCCIEWVMKYAKKFRKEWEEKD